MKPRKKVLFDTRILRLANGNKILTFFFLVLCLDSAAQSDSIMNLARQLKSARFQEHKLIKRTQLGLVDFIRNPLDSANSLLKNFHRSDQDLRPDKLFKSQNARIHGLAAISFPANDIQAGTAKFNKNWKDPNILLNERLTRLNVMQHRISHTGDSLQNKVRVRLADYEKDITGPLKKYVTTITSGIRSSTPSLGTISGAGLTDVPPISGTSPELKELPSSNLKSFSLPETTLPEINDPGAVNSAITLPKGITEVNAIPGVNEASELSSKMTSLNNQVVAAKKIEGEGQKIVTGNMNEMAVLPGAIEKKLAQQVDLQPFQNQKMLLTSEEQKYKAMIERYKDSKLLETEIKKKSSLIANSLVNANMPFVKDVQTGFTRIKRTFGNVQSVKNLPSVKPNEFRGKPFLKRLTIGTDLQIYQNRDLIIDLAPSVGYNISDHWVAGVSYMYRIDVSKSNKYYLHSKGVQGDRLFTKFFAGKGFFLQSEWEALRLDIERINFNTELKYHQVYSINAGIGKVYPITRTLNGSVNILYRIQYDGVLPSQNKYNFRLGFYLNQKNGKRHRVRLPALSPAKKINS